MEPPSHPDCLTPREWKARMRAARGSLHVHVVGIPYSVRPEEHHDATMVDHVWMEVDVPPCGLVRLSLNTYSKLNERAGFDPRMRVASIISPYTDLPAPVIEEALPLDYRVLDEGVPYIIFEHDPLQALLIASAQRALRIEAWGEPYTRAHLGLHQLHSRRASCAVARDYLGKDGAVKFYYPDKTEELLLFKFCGQK